MRFPRSHPFDVPVTSVNAKSKSHPSRRQLCTINPTLDVVQLLTPTAAVELAVRPSQLNRVIAPLASPDPA
jgi:hypothetical protein